MPARALTAISLTLALGACATTSEPAPTVAVAPAYRDQGPWTVATMPAAPAGAWWEMFGDPVLSALAARIETDAPRLAVAVARYDQAAARAQRARADFWPDIAIGGDIARNRDSGRTNTTDDAGAGVSLAYEIDVFGRLRSTSAAANASAEASASDLAAVRLGLQAQLATLYFDLRGLDARLALLRDTLGAFQRAYDLTDTRHEGGIASGLDVSRARTQLANARAEIDELQINRARDEHAIAILVGESPSAFTIAPAAREIAPPAIPVGVPSTLLLRRPDVIAAERRVVAANAQIGAARAAYFPRITLGGGSGYEGGTDGLFKAANRYWSLGPLAASLPIFDGGARKANLRITEAQYDGAAADYRDTVLSAFGEVEGNLATLRLLASQESNQGDAATAAKATLDLALSRYRDGAADYLDVVSAQTSSLDAERALLNLRTDQLKASADLVRALGGLAPTS